jgi:hypothetical protein
LQPTIMMGLKSKTQIYEYFLWSGGIIRVHV